MRPDRLLLQPQSTWAAVRAQNPSRQLVWSQALPGTLSGDREGLSGPGRDRAMLALLQLLLVAGPLCAWSACVPVYNTTSSRQAAAARQRPRCRASTRSGGALQGGGQAERAPGASHPRRRRLAEDGGPVLLRGQAGYPGPREVRCQPAAPGAEATHNRLSAACVQLAGVQYVLDTVTQALALNPDRTFIYGEIVRLCSQAPLAWAPCCSAVL